MGWTTTADGDGAVVDSSGGGMMGWSMTADRADADSSGSGMIGTGGDGERREVGTTIACGHK